VQGRYRKCESAERTREQAAGNAESVEQEGGERRRGEESQGRNLGFVKVAVVNGKSLEHLQRCSVCKPTQLFLTFKFSYLFPFSNHTHKTKTGIANRRETSTVNPRYNHTHFTHILARVTYLFLIIICFNKKHHYVE
jgi:hypothetical protein